MQTLPREIVFHREADGKIPVQNWLASLGHEVRSIVLRRLEHIRGGSLGDYKHIDGGVYEFRIHAKQGIRLYFAFEGKRMILLLCGGEKSGQKRDIRRAIKYYQDYEKRKEK